MIAIRGRISCRPPQDRDGNARGTACRRSADQRFEWRLLGWDALVQV